MSAFEFFFTLYGLVLGLSVVTVVSGFARLAHDRRGVKVGWLTPMLALLMLLDLASFWTSAYARLQNYDLSYSVLVISLIIAALYYVAASVVFPQDFEAEPDFDAVFLRHRRLVMTTLITCGLLAFEVLPLLTAEGRAARLAAWTNPGSLWPLFLFLVPAVAIMIIKNRRMLLALLVLMIIPYGVQFLTTLPH